MHIQKQHFLVALVARTLELLGQGVESVRVFLNALIGGEVFFSEEVGLCH